MGDTVIETPHEEPEYTRSSTVIPTVVVSCISLEDSRKISVEKEQSELQNLEPLEKTQDPKNPPTILASFYLDGKLEELDEQYLQQKEEADDEKFHSTVKGVFNQVCWPLFIHIRIKSISFPKHNGVK